MGDLLIPLSALAAAALFARGFVRLRRRGRREEAGWDRAALFAAGTLAGLLGLLLLHGPAEERASAHMLQHVLVADLGVALALLAVRGPLSLFFLPRDLLAPLARTGWLRGALSLLLRPGVAVALWLTVLVAWHVPVLYEAALTEPLVHRLEHLSFVVAGALVWTLLIDPAGHRRLHRNGRIALAVVLFWVGQVLAYVFVFGFEPYYAVYADQPERLLGLSPLTDQKLAGVVMMAEQTLTLGLAIVLLVRGARRARAAHGATPEPV